MSILENAESTRAYYASNGIVKSIVGEGAWNLAGTEFRYVDEESKTRKKLSRYRFFWRPIEGSLWLYGKIAGHTGGEFENAIAIVEGLIGIVPLTAEEAFRGLRRKLSASESLTAPTDDEWP